MSSTLDYIKTIAATNGEAAQLVSAGYDAKTKMISAASQFFGTRAEVAKIANQVSQYNVSCALTAAEKNQMSELTLIGEHSKALLAEVQSLSQAVAALFNNLQADAGTKYTVSA